MIGNKNKNIEIPTAPAVPLLQSQTTIVRRGVPLEHLQSDKNFAPFKIFPNQSQIFIIQQIKPIT